MKYILAIDQGTTSSRAFLIDAKGRIVAQGQREFQQHYPQPGWVEHDANEIWLSVCESIQQALNSSTIDATAIAGIGITNQRETTVLWDRTTSEPLHKAIVWQCRRTTDMCTQLKQQGLEETVREKTGLVLDPYFSGTKIAWLLDQNEVWRTRAESGEFAFGTIDSFLIARLSGGDAHVTDVSNASRTLLMRLSDCQWDDQLCDLLRVPQVVLPKIVASSGICAETRGVPGLPDGIPIAGIAGDQQAALFGQACFAPGEAKCTYGTGSFILMNTGSNAVPSQNGLLTTVAWQLGDSVTYALEGASFIAGAAVQWLRDGMGLIERSSDIEALAAEADSSEGVVFVPALAGLGAPHWRSEARGTIRGITRGTTRAHLARAALEGIALQQCDLLRAMTQDSGVAVKQLRVDGGAAANNLLMQLQSDLLDTKLVRPDCTETTVMGAAYLAGLAVGVWDSLECIQKQWQANQEFSPHMSAENREQLLAQWQRAVACA